MSHVLLQRSASVSAVALASIAMTGCHTYSAGGKNPDRPSVPTRPVDVIVEGAVNGTPTPSMPMRMPDHLSGARLVLVPIVIQEEKGFFEREDPYTSSSARNLSAGRTADSALYGSASQRAAGGEVIIRYPGARGLRWNNVFFVMRSNEENRTFAALDRRAVITSYQTFGPPSEIIGWDPPPPGSSKEPTPVYSELETEAIVLTATIEDTNRNGALDVRDAETLLFSNGGPFREVLPGNRQIDQLRFEPDLFALYVLSKEDSDADGRFTVEDRSHLELIDLRSGERSALVSTSEIEQATQFYME